MCSFFFFFKQKTAYEITASDWSSDVCSSDLYGDTIPVAGGVDVTFREPLGVVGLIVPWNFPLNISSWKLGPALATGNTVVLKPAELPPMSALRLSNLVLEAGIPEGVVNVLVGKGSVVGSRL